MATQRTDACDRWELVARLLRSDTFRARQLRRSATAAEKLLWQCLRDRRLDGVKFRRQQPLGPYFADFFSEEARLVVEADGDAHAGREDYDRARDNWLRLADLTVVRLSNDEILHDTPAALERIRRAIRCP